jgi:hypothetical protein
VDLIIGIKRMTKQQTDLLGVFIIIGAFLGVGVIASVVTGGIGHWVAIIAGIGMGWLGVQAVRTR